MARQRLYEGPKGEALWAIYQRNGAFSVLPPGQDMPRGATLEGYAATERDARRIASHRQADSHLAVDRFSIRRQA